MDPRAVSESYLDWVLAYARTQVRKRFQTFRDISYMLVPVYLDVVNSLPPPQRMMFAVAMVKKRARRKLSRTDILLTTAEEQLCEMFDQALQYHSFPRVRNESKGVRRQVRNIIKRDASYLGALVGEPPAGAIFERTLQCGILVRTMIDTGSRSGILGYQHNLEFENQLLLPGRINKLDWIGIGGGGTHWQAGDAVEIVSSFKQACQEFETWTRQLDRQLLSGRAPEAHEAPSGQGKTGALSRNKSSKTVKSAR